MVSEIRRGVPDEELTKIIVTEEDSKTITWEEKDKEFFMNGNMYDVVRCQINEGKIIYYCIVDEKESSLYKQLNNNISNVINENGKFRTLLKYFSFAGFYVLQEMKKTTQFIRLKWITPDEKPLDNFRVVLYPPPKGA